MEGLMMGTQLLVSSLLRNAAENHATTEVVSRSVEGPIHRYGYADLERRARRLANALQSLGVGPSDRVGTLAWNTYRHLEIYYAVSGSGAVCHTINPRLFPPQISYIVDHGEDKVLFLDLTFVPLVERLASEFKTVRAFVIMTDEAHMPETDLPNALCYETLMHGASEDFEWPSFDENTASSLCYSSGTTGNPKGVLYSHRSTVLHAMSAALPDVIDVSAADATMPAVPMFHVNAWGFPYFTPMMGAKLVLPGPLADGASIHELLENERVTISAGVPTVWLGLLQYLEESGKTLSTVKRLVIGGSAVPRAMTEAFLDRHGVEVRHAWGMTEMSPLGTINTPPHGMGDETPERFCDRQVKQGRAFFGVEMKIVDDDDNTLPEDGVSFGMLKVRGPWVCRAYYRESGSDTHDGKGWFATGDVATIDETRNMQVTDRSKDVIKSGGEWISSIDLENIAVGHPDVAEAASIGVRHPKWDERPLLVVVRREGAELTKEDMLSYFDGKVARWWIPDDVVFVDELPHTATGKLLKMQLREDYKDYVLPTA